MDCPTCGAIVTQPPVGRRRVYCLQCSPPSDWRPRSDQELKAFCKGCGCEIIAAWGRKFCSDECRYRHRDHYRSYGQLTCADCGADMWKGHTSAPQGQARCRKCRQASAGSRERPAYWRHTCEDCGQPCSGKKRCKPCDSLARRQDADPRHIKAKKRRAYAARVAREVGSPGLNASQRRRLLERWKLQAKSCVYCDNLATSIDHVIPLARGGTHFEGNLAPCCSACNSSKSAFTVAEWRHRRRTHPRYIDPPPLAVREPRPYRPKRLPMLHACPVCAAWTSGGRKHCSDECMTEWGRRTMRDRYRQSVGLPWDHSEPSGKWKRGEQLTLPIAC